MLIMDFDIGMAEDQTIYGRPENNAFSLSH